MHDTIIHQAPAIACCALQHYRPSTVLKVIAMVMQGALRFRLRRKMRVMSQVEGDSSGGEEEADSAQTCRGSCGQFVWPCPREYPLDATVRKNECRLIPADLTKEAAGRLFREVLAKYGQSANIVKVHVFDEPHKRYNTQTGVRERHKHVIFKMHTSFAHTRIQKELASHGIYGHFSFNLVGYVAYLQYMMVPSAKKLLADLDRDPWSSPCIAPCKLLALCEKNSPQMESRNGGKVGSGRKRKLLTFSEITDIFVEESIACEKDAWMLAKRRKQAGDDVLFNTLGDGKSVSALVSRVRVAWSCENMSPGTLVTKPQYHLGAFIPVGEIDKRLLAWLQHAHRDITLILFGPGGLGKTKLAGAMMHRVCQSKSYHFLNKLDRLRDILIAAEEGLVVDEVCLAGRDIDDVKALLDLEETRDVTCRNKDGTIPARTPRIFCTNWSWGTFWPREAFNPEHLGAIRRRVLWVEVKKESRRCGGSGSDDWEVPFEDVFGFGGSLE
jgi:hypothetical protein